jgi:hypothetical protein
MFETTNHLSVLVCPFVACYTPWRIFTVIACQCSKYTQVSTHHFSMMLAYLLTILGGNVHMRVNHGKSTALLYPTIKKIDM